MVVWRAGPWAGGQVRARAGGRKEALGWGTLRCSACHGFFPTPLKTAAGGHALPLPPLPTFLISAAVALVSTPSVL